MSKGEKIILKDDKGKQYELIRVLDFDTKKIIDDLSALVVKKDKIINLMAEDLNYFYDDNAFENKERTIEDTIKKFEKRCK